MEFKEWLRGPSHPLSVKKAYEEMQKALSRDEVNENFDGNFSRLQELQRNGDPDPLMNVNWQTSEAEQDPVVRWRNQIEAMVTSGNPVLQKEGLELMNAQHQREIAQESSQQGLSTAAKMAKELGLTPGTKAWNDFITAYAFKANRNYAPKYVTPAEAEKLSWLDTERTEPIVGQNWEDIRGLVRTIDPADELRAGAATVIDNLERLLISPEEGIYNDSVWDLDGAPGVLLGGFVGAVQDISQKDERYKAYSDLRAGSAAQIVRAMGEKGALANKDIDRALAMLPNVSGARGMPDTRATAQLKLRYLRLMLNMPPTQWPAILDTAEKDIAKTQEATQPPAQRADNDAPPD